MITKRRCNSLLSRLTSRRNKSHKKQTDNPDNNMSSSSSLRKKQEEEAEAELKRRKEMQERPQGSLSVTPPLSEDEKAPQQQQPPEPEPQPQPPIQQQQQQQQQQQLQHQQQQQTSTVTTTTERNVEEDLHLFPQRLASDTSVEEGGPQKSAFGSAIDRDYRRALEEGIKKAMDKVSRRFSMMLSQERTPMDVARDALGNDTDYYENLMDAVRSGDPSAGSTLEDVYIRLYNLAFTEMRSLDALKQQYYPP